MVEDTNAARYKALALCQKMIRINTGIILAAFTLIIVLTTVSTAEWVRATSKVLYYVIVSQALASAMTWYYRTRLEKALARIEGDGSNGDH
ncbi:MAG: hypothetical protein OXE49_20455 [Gemmatimonadetes bacterium]|nr:hypothetical protein [Gemmatimonadota bacterium]